MSFEKPPLCFPFNQGQVVWRRHVSILTYFPEIKSDAINLALSRLDNMEKKVIVKKKTKSQIKKEEFAMKFVDLETALPVCQTTDETAGEKEGSITKAKPKSRKRKVSYEEDVIDGFLMLSYTCLEDLEVSYQNRHNAVPNGKAYRGIPSSSLIVLFCVLLVKGFSQP